MKRDLRLVPFALTSWVCAYVAISMPSLALPFALALWGAVSVCIALSFRMPRGTSRGTNVRGGRRRGVLALGGRALRSPQ